MTAKVDAFVAAVGRDAVEAGRATGVSPWLVLAQWGVETGWGTSPAWRRGHNYGGVSPGGHLAYYPDRGAGLDAYVRALSNPRYDPVRKVGTKNPTEQAKALAASPWASGHYRDKAGHEGASLLDALGQVVNAKIPAGVDLDTASAAGEVRVQRVPGEAAVTGAVGSAVGAAKGVVGGIFGGLQKDIAHIVFAGLFLTTALGLVVLGAWRMVPSATRDKASTALAMGAAAA